METTNIYQDVKLARKSKERLNISHWRKLKELDSFFWHELEHKNKRIKSFRKEVDALISMNCTEHVQRLSSSYSIGKGMYYTRSTFEIVLREFRTQPSILLTILDKDPTLTNLRDMEPELVNVFFRNLTSENGDDSDLLSLICQIIEATVNKITWIYEGFDKNLFLTRILETLYHRTDFSDFCEYIMSDPDNLQYLNITNFLTKEIVNQAIHKQNQMINEKALRTIDLKLCEEYTNQDTITLVEKFLLKVLKNIHRIPFSLKLICMQYYLQLSDHSYYKYYMIHEDEDFHWAIITHILYPSIFRPIWEHEYKNVTEISQITKVAATAKFMEACFSIQKLKTENRDIAEAVERNRFIATLIIQEILKMDPDIPRSYTKKKAFQGPIASCLSIYGFWKICLMIDKFRDVLKEPLSSNGKKSMLLERTKNLESLKKLLDEDFPDKQTKIFVMVKDYEPLSIQLFEKYEKEYRISSSKSGKILNLKYFQVHLMRALTLDTLFGEEMDIVDWIKFKLQDANPLDLEEINTYRELISNFVTLKPRYLENNGLLLFKKISKHLFYLIENFQRDYIEAFDITRKIHSALTTSHPK